VSALAAVTLLLGLEGTPRGWLAGILVVVWVGVLWGLPYMILASSYGAKQAYLVVGAATSVVMILLGAIWLFGAPGTIPGTGPRGREPAWVPFLATSEQASDFDAVKRFPNGWDQPGKKFSGGLDSGGELTSLEDTWRPVLAARAASQGTGATEPDDWSFRTTDKPTTDEEKRLPLGRVYFTESGSHVIAGVTISATDKHPETTVFAYRDKGQIFYWAAIILGVSIVGFILHVWALAILEKRGRLPTSSPATT
jgi:hypothetical protein